MEQQAVFGPRRRGRRVLVGTLVFLLVVASGLSAVLFFKYQRAVSDTSAKEAEDITHRIGTVLDLPQGKPAISTVLDKTKLTNEALKRRAENGDKLLIYAKAKRLILYRPASGKVIDILTIQDSQPSYTDPPVTNITPTGHTQ